MGTLTIEVDTAKSGMDELRSVLDVVLERRIGVVHLEHHWDGDVLHLSGPGARGTVRYRDGKLLAEARLRLPATLFRTLIEERLRDALEEAAG